MKTNNLLLHIWILLIFACSNDDNSIQPSCFQSENREIVAVFESANGYVLAPDANCSSIYTLIGGPNSEGRRVERLAPCNLENDFKIDSLRIEYDGFLYETFETENICAQKFEITKIKVIKE